MAGEILRPTEFDGPRDNCAVIGVRSRQAKVPQKVLDGLIELNHRGQEESGMVVSNGYEFQTVKDTGLAEAVFVEKHSLPKLQGVFIAAGHDRYSTSGSLSESQPFLEDGIALAHNGNLTNVSHLREKYSLPEEIDGARSDSRMALAIINKQEGTVKEKILSALKEFEGAYSFVLMDKDTLYASRDPHGFRPLALGKLNEGGYAVASESAAFKHMGGSFVREIQPGETISIDDNGVKTIALDRKSPLAQCIFELIYVSRIDSVIFGIPVMQFRLRLGETLAKYLPDNAEVIMPVPRSGIGAAQGVATAEAARIKGIPYLEGVYTNPYRGIARGPRTFMRPEGRREAARIKYSPIGYTLKDKVVVMVEDSIVRGSVDVPVEMAREAGAKEVHLLVSCPPIGHQCFFGVDMGNGGHGEFLANRLPDLDDRRKSLGLDSLHYLSKRELIEAALGNPLEVDIDENSVFENAGFCGSCFTGKYPIKVDGVISKH